MKINFESIQRYLNNLSDEIKNTETFNKTFKEMLIELKLSKDQYLDALKMGIKRDDIFLKRELNAVNVNAYNEVWLRECEANMDIQFCLHPCACVTYLTAYISKSMRGISKLLKDANKDAEQKGSTIQEQVQSLAYILTNGSEISAQEAVYQTLSMDLSHMSRQCIFINNGPPDQRYHMLKSESELKLLPADSTDITYKNIMDYYVSRPNNLQIVNDLCLAEFTASYTYAKTRKGLEDETFDTFDTLKKGDVDVNLPKTI